MAETGKYTDARDGRVYKTFLRIDGLWQFAENLAYLTAGSKDFDDNPANRPIYGLRYLLSDAEANLPAGCRMMTGAETLRTSNDYGGTYASGKHLKAASDLWSPNTGDNSSGFSALPSPPLQSFRVTSSLSDGVGIILQASLDSAITFSISSGTYYPIRPIVVSGNVPDYNQVAIFGAPFQGFERGYSLEISRKISESFARGSAPVLWPYAPADKDEWIVDAEIWVTAAQAAEIQARVPPKGAPLERAISVPPRSGVNTFAGLAPANAGDSADTYLDPVVLSLESLGQKAVAVDIYGFRIRFSLSCSSISNPYSSNPATPPTATPPSWLNQKFRVHQIEDCSVEERVIAPSGKWSASPNPIKAGRGLPLSITLDYLTQERADELVAFFRGIRSNTFTAPLDFPGATSTSFVARKLSLSRPGLHWEGTLEVYQA